MGYRQPQFFVPVRRVSSFVPPPTCRNLSRHLVPVKSVFTGHAGPLRFFACPICAKTFTVSVG